jgi:hypothetical protein
MEINKLRPEYVYHVPDKMEEGVLYISREFRLANHLCACGCGIETVTPLGKDDWQITDSNGLVTLRPSIGNFRWENPYHAHYCITNNNI